MKRSGRPMDFRNGNYRHFNTSPKEVMSHKRLQRDLYYIFLGEVWPGEQSVRLWWWFKLTLGCCFLCYNTNANASPNSEDFEGQGVEWLAVKLSCDFQVKCHHRGTELKGAIKHIDLVVLLCCGLSMRTEPKRRYDSSKCSTGCSVFSVGTQSSVSLPDL